MDAWRKSTYSSAEGGSCVEVGGDASAVLVRDTKAWTNTVLRLTRDDFRGLTSTLKRTAT